MATSIITTFAQEAGEGYLLRLSIEPVESRGVSCPERKTGLDFHISMQRAFIAAWTTLGQPRALPGARCTFEALNTDHVPELHGGSLYGAFSMVFLRFFAHEGHKSGMRRQLRGQLDRGLLTADLGGIAVSAQGDPATGDFRPVEGIEQKLTALAGLPDKELFACVLAHGQKATVAEPRDDGPIVKTLTPQQFLKDLKLRNSKLRSFPIIFAADPVDAILQVFERQAGATRIA